MEFKIGDIVEIKSLKQIKEINKKYNVSFPEHLRRYCNKIGIITEKAPSCVGELYMYRVKFPDLPWALISFYGTEFRHCIINDKQFIDLQLLLNYVY